MSALFYLIPVLHVLLTVWLLFVFFLACMALQSALDRKTLTPWGLRVGYTVLVVGYVLDFTVQITLASVLFLELPKEITVSSRVKRLITTDAGWRGDLAAWLRDHLLMPFDATGGHN